MPHQCTNCGRAFDDGSKQMLSGCPDCGGNKFQFRPESAVDGSTSAGGGGTTEAEPGRTPAATPANTSPSDPGPESPAEAGSDIIEAPPEPIDDRPPAEDRAQATARSSIVSEDELPPPPDPAERSAPDDEEERPGLSELREELNQQFESIKILRPGEYELNLMELYDREEYIIALEEDGRYVIDVPGTWHDDD